MLFFFFFQAEDGIRDKLVTGVQTCALPISVDLGAGGRTNAFSFFGWARRATLTKAPATDNQVAVTGTRVPADPTVCLTTLHPSARPLVGEPVAFTVTSGGGSVDESGTTAVVRTG